MGKFASEGMDLSKPSTLLSAPFKRLGNAAIGSSINASKATSEAIGKASGAALTSVKNSTALLNESIKIALPSFMKTK
jgi:hypothetical protein